MNNNFAMKSYGDDRVAGWWRKYDGFATNSVEHIFGGSGTGEWLLARSWQHKGSCYFFLFVAK